MATVSGQTIIGLLAGAVIVETIFNRTGIGSFMSWQLNSWIMPPLWEGLYSSVYTGFRET